MPHEATMFQYSIALQICNTRDLIFPNTYKQLFPFLPVQSVKHIESFMNRDTIQQIKHVGGMS
jgi:hypothetical protein